MTAINRKGASANSLTGALDLIDEAGGPDAYLYAAAARREPLTRAPSSVDLIPTLSTARYAIALEIALNQEEERRAMNGELAMLQAAWREAEGIAAIADALPGEPPAPG